MVTLEPREKLEEAEPAMTKNTYYSLPAAAAGALERLPEREPFVVPWRADLVSAFDSSPSRFFSAAWINELNSG